MAKMLKVGERVQVGGEIWVVEYVHPSRALLRKEAKKRVTLEAPDKKGRARKRVAFYAKAKTISNAADADVERLPPLEEDEP